MKTLFNTAKAYGVRPSEMLKVQDEWMAYQLDVTVMAMSQQKKEKPPISLKNLGGVQVING